MTIETVSEKTIASKFKRLSYFHGMLLTEDDLIEEQTYFREKLKLHNKLHGKGIVFGLEVTPFPLPPTLKAPKKEDPQQTNDPNFVGSSTVTIQPGFALDCDGNEIMICRPYNVDLSKYIEFIINEFIHKCDSSNGTCKSDKVNSNEPIGYIHLGVIYGECLSNPSSQYVTTCDIDPQKQYSRTREGFLVVLRLELIKQKNPTQPQINGCNGTNRTSTTIYCNENHDYPQELVIPLARICICKSLSMIDNEEFVSEVDTISRNKILMDGIRMYVWPWLSLQKWESARQTLLSLKESKKWDVSIVVGLTRDRAINLLTKEMQMTVDTMSLKPSTMSDKHFEAVLTFKPFVQEKSSIILITDEYEEKVLFVLTTNSIQ